MTQGQNPILWTWSSAVGETGYRVMAGTANLSGNLPAHTVSWLRRGCLRTPSNAFIQPREGGEFQLRLALHPGGHPGQHGGHGALQRLYYGELGGGRQPAGTVYELDRSTTGVGFLQLSTGALPGFAAADLAALQAYFYEARAFNGYGIPTPFAQAVPTMTLAALGGAAPGGAANQSGVRVYSIPYKPNGPNPDEGRPFVAGDFSTGIIFDNLTQSVDIKIYNVAGQLVTELSSDSTGGRLQWDARNGSGRDVTSGNYSAVFKTAGQGNVVRRLMIIR